MNLEKIKTTYIKVAGLTMVERQKLVSLIESYGLGIYSNSKESVLSPHDTNYYPYLFYGPRNRVLPMFVRFRRVLSEQSVLSIATFEEYSSYFSLEVKLQYNKQKFTVL